MQIRWNTFCSCIMKKLSQHGTTWNSQVMMLSVMVRTFVTLCRDKCVWSYVTLWNSAQGIWNIKDKKEVCISIFCGYIGKNLHTIIFSSFYESFKHSNIIHCCFFRKCVFGAITFTKHVIWASLYHFPLTIFMCSWTWNIT